MCCGANFNEPFFALSNIYKGMLAMCMKMRFSKNNYLNFLFPLCVVLVNKKFNGCARKDFLTLLYPEDKVQ